MKDILNKVKTVTLITTSIMTVDGWMKSRSSAKTNQILEDVLKHNEDRLQKMDAMKSVMEIRDDKSNAIFVKLNSTYSRVLEHYKELQKNESRIKTYSEDTESTIIEEIRRDSVEILNKISVEISEFESNSGTELDNVIKSIGGVDPTKLVDNLLTNFQSYLDTLTTDQQGALAHLLFSLTMIYLAWSIFTLYYADKMIIYFNLEEKYPRIARFFKYRRTLQHYSIGFNLLLIFLVSVYFAYANILVLNGL